MDMRYNASIEDIAELAHALFESDATAVAHRTTYLRMLVGTSQFMLGSVVTPKDPSTQMNCLNATHERFYPQIVEAAGPGTNAELNRRTNFARTALYAARSWIRGGRDLCSLNVGTLTKAMLMADHTSTQLTPKRMKVRVERDIARLVADTEQLAKLNKVMAREQLTGCVFLLKGALEDLGGPVKRPRGHDGAGRRGHAVAHAA